MCVWNYFLARQEGDSSLLSPTSICSQSSVKRSQFFRVKRRLSISPKEIKIENLFKRKWQLSLLFLYNKSTTASPL